MMSMHVVESNSQTVRSGYLDPAATAVAAVVPGDTVRYPDTWTHWGNEAVYGMTFADREPLRHRYPHGPYSMVGPVEVTGAMPGDVIEFTMLALRTIDWGWNSFPLGVGALPSDFAQPYVHYFRFDDERRVAAYTHGISLPMAPFLGVLAVEPAGDAETSAILAGPYGGNLVLRDLRVGSSLFLPVAKPGGRIWIGDVHALQGDGVVDQTAIETAAENLEIRYDLHSGVALRAPGGDPGQLDRHRLRRRPRRCADRVPARADPLARRRHRALRVGGVRAGQHGGELPGESWTCSQEPTPPPAPATPPRTWRCSPTMPSWTAIRATTAAARPSAAGSWRCGARSRRAPFT
jgi:acetamidase/formamidase